MNPFELDGIIYDKDSESLDSLSYTWNCNDFIKNEEFKTIMGDNIVLKNSQSNKFQPKLFEPYTTF